MTGQDPFQGGGDNATGVFTNLAEANTILAGGNGAGEATTVIAEEQITQINETLVPKPDIPRRPNPRQQLNKLYALPAPLRTFPLPTFVPHNPLSLLHILYSWISQTIYPPSSHFDTLYQGYWSPATRSVHITDNRSIRGLWEQGFYGKGNLSRSEPNWLAKEKTRKGSKGKATSEELTQQRRAERQQTKWERARKEREAIERKLSEEAEAERALEESLSSQEDMLHESDTSLTDDEEGFKAECLRLPTAPVGPLELLALPNSTVDLYEYQHSTSEMKLDEWQTMPVQTLADEVLAVVQSLSRHNEPVPLARRDDSEDSTDFHDRPNGYSLLSSTQASITGIANEFSGKKHAKMAESCHVGVSDNNDDANNGSVLSDQTTPESSNFVPNGSALVNESPHLAPLKRQKSVRFSPMVEKNTFIQSDPPSPDRAVTPSTEDVIDLVSVAEIKESSIVETEKEPAVIKNEEHFQLTTEEAFFLSYTLGALTILDLTTKEPIPNKNLFELFRQSSSFPPLATPSISPDDTFMLNYVVYHHYRSLGWVVRGGSKFSVDFMLYKRGPVFTHAEFAVLILPSYNDEYWSRDAFLQNYVKNKEKRTWAWLHCINRVITQVKKTLILVYVDVPAPFDGEKDLSLDEMFGRYKVREFSLKRWSPNRQRGERMVKPAK